MSNTSLLDLVELLMSIDIAASKIKGCWYCSRDKWHHHEPDGVIIVY